MDGLLEGLMAQGARGAGQALRTASSSSVWQQSLTSGRRGSAAQWELYPCDQLSAGERHRQQGRDQLSLNPLLRRKGGAAIPSSPTSPSASGPKAPSSPARPCRHGDVSPSGDELASYLPHTARGQRPPGSGALATVPLVERRSGMPDDELPMTPGVGADNDPPPHVVRINDQEVLRKAKSNVNYVSTTKYTMLTFLPKALYEQFRRVANLYFTVVAVLSCTEMSPVSPYTTIPPLVLVVGISVIKEGYEDYKRYKADKTVNQTKVLVWREGQWGEILWQELKVGELVQVRRGEFFPADLAFLSSSNMEDGTCYVETMNLDGETNLKIKNAVDCTKGLHCRDAGMMRMLSGKVECDQPNNSIYTFTGNLKLDTATAQAVKLGSTGSLRRQDAEGNRLADMNPDDVFPLSPSNLLLRGASLRNTDNVLGSVVYAGHDTKMMMNTTQAPSKRSQIEKSIDGIIFFMFGLLAIMCGTGAICNALWTRYYGNKMYYLMPSKGNYEFDPEGVELQSLANLITVIILYGYLIPISLYVSVEMVKVMQLMLINSDRQMYHPDTDTPALARTSNLNEELGQVHTVLSDKTGTLTCNVMEFFKCSVAGQSYGTGHTEVERSIARRNGLEIPPDPPNPLKKKGFNLAAPNLMGNNWRKERHPEIVEHFARLMAICHTVIPEGPEEEVVYQAESPDELAFISAARELGFCLTRRQSDALFVRETKADGSKPEVMYDILNVIEFNSDRKRMSIIFKGPDGKIMLYCKGADAVLLPRLRRNGNAFTEATMKHAEEFGLMGLRTLILTATEIAYEDWVAWNEQWQTARKALVDRERKMGAVAERIEVNLTVLGCTAIEDKLQEGVPRCIETLMQAGLRVWVLTGDKLETALNIGFACGLLKNEMVQYILNVETPEVLLLEEGRNKELYQKRAKEVIIEQLKDSLADLAKGGTQNALVIDGKALQFALSREARPLLLELGMKCQAVMACRVSPLQKAQVTNLVKQSGLTCLAIGDGANDVGMIQCAHIGVGISGQEGRQAVMAADFAIAQFAFLERLMLDHGRWSYKRIGRMISYFFYKNVLFGLSMFWFQFWAFFSGQTIYDDYYMSLYNVCFVALPIIVVGFMDQDVTIETRKRYPQLYMQGQRNEYFNRWSIGMWMLNGVYQSMVIFAMPSAVYATTPGRDGRQLGLWAQGTVMYTCVIFSVNLNLAMVLNYWTWVQHFVVWATLAAWPIFLAFYGSLPPEWSVNVYQLWAEVLSFSPAFYLVCLVTVVAALLPDLVFRVLQRMYFPQDHHIIQELELQRRQNRRRNDVEAGKRYEVTRFEVKAPTRNTTEPPGSALP